MKLGILSSEAFGKALNNLNQQALPASLAYKLSKVAAKAQEESKEYFRLRADVITRYTKLNEDGTRKIIEKNGGQFLDFGDDADTVTKEIAELDATEVEVPKIKVSDLDKASVKISGFDMNALSDILED